MTILLKELGPRARALINTADSPQQATVSPSELQPRQSSDLGWTPLHTLVSSPCAYYMLMPHQAAPEASELNQTESADQKRSGETVTNYDEEAGDKNAKEMDLAYLELVLKQLQGAAQHRRCYPGVDTLMIMIQAGANMGAKTNRGKTAFQLVQFRRSENDPAHYIRRILQEASDSLATGAKAGNLHFVSQLLGLGLDVNTVGACGRMALHEVTCPNLLSNMRSVDT
eukprot:scaffold84385_cov19-Prasinocladus_malaysianus.AAC.1